MTKVKNNDSIVFEILDFIFGAAELLPLPLETPYAHIKRLRRYPQSSAYNTVSRLRKKGVVDVFSENNQKFIRLTKKGQLKLLLQKSKFNKPKAWDGKWRLVMFDIPEGSRKKRNQLRRLLKQSGFILLQQSVFINPYPLNREAISFLKETGLIEYIRIMEVDNIDDDSKLKKKFNLK